jgi:hypothetical protein
VLRSLIMFSVLTLSVFIAYCNQSLSFGQNQSPAPSPAPAQTPSAQSTPQKPKKVWTNENLSDANGTISVVGNAKSPSDSKLNPNKPADPNYVANTKKQLDKFQEDIDDTDKQIAQLSSFSKGEPSPTAGIQVHKSYDRDPPDVQIRELQEKKKQLQDKMAALLDEARKKGVEPGQLR